MVQAEIRTIQAKMQLLGKRIMRSDKTDTKMREEWSAYATEWSAWRKEHTKWIDRQLAWSGTWDKLMQYRRRTNQWVTRAAKLGLVDEETEKIRETKGMPWSNILWGAGLLLGLTFLMRR
jgi:hypothetical protein